MAKNVQSKTWSLPVSWDGRRYSEAADVPAQEGGGGGSDPLAISASVITHGSDLTITTDGTYDFGSKTQAAPVHWQFGDEIYINGVSRTDGANVWGGTTDVVDYVAGAARHSRVAGGYRAIGAGSKTDAAGFAGNPASDTKLYFSFWVKPNCKFNRAYIHSTTATSGTFITYADGRKGESVTITRSDGGTIQANILRISTNAVAYELPVGISPSISVLNGQTMTGNLSGATATLGTTSAATGAVKVYRSAHGNYNASEVRTRSIHAWNNGGQQTVYGHNASNVQQWVSRVDNTGNATEQIWNLYECYQDFSGATGSLVRRVNGATQYSVSGLSVAQLSTVRGFNLSNLGLDSPGQSPFDALNNAGVAQDWGEIYADKTPQRVCIGNAATWSACTKFDMQRPTAWSANSITVKTNCGDYSSNSTVYLYVVGVSGEPVTTSGVALGIA